MLASDLSNLSTIRVPKLVHVSRLDLYADSSKSAYGAAAFISDENSSYSIITLARVAPIKQLTLLQIELMAVKLASNIYVYLSKTFQNELKFSVETVWTESKIVLSWLSSEKGLGVFFNRMTDFRKIPNNVNLSHVAGVLAVSLPETFSCFFYTHLRASSHFNCLSRKNISSNLKQMLRCNMIV